MNRAKIAIHQPNYIPWGGYFYKILVSDKFVILDNVQYTKNSFINRNRIKGSNGEPLWLTIPVSGNLVSKISEVKVAQKNWAQKHIKTLSLLYSKAEYFSPYFDEFSKCISHNNDSIMEINLSVIRLITRWLNCKTEIVLASSLEIDQSLTGDSRLVEIIRFLNGGVYISGKGGANYQNPETFKHSNIELKYTSYSPVAYNQIRPPFIGGLSILDTIFNCGPETKSLLLKGGREND